MKKAFTLIELLVVIGIVLLLASIVISDCPLGSTVTEIVPKNVYEVTGGTKETRRDAMLQFLCKHPDLEIVSYVDEKNYHSYAISFTVKIKVRKAEVDQ